MSDYITIVLRLPEDKKQRAEISKALPIGGNFNGAKVTAMSLEDESTLLDVLTQDIPDYVVGEARQKVKQLQEASERSDL